MGKFISCLKLKENMYMRDTLQWHFRHLSLKSLFYIFSVVTSKTYNSKQLERHKFVGECMCIKLEMNLYG